MENLLTLGGRLVGAAGILLCVIAVICRVVGSYFFAGLQIGTLLQAGTAAVAIGCFLLLQNRPAQR